MTKFFDIKEKLKGPEKVEATKGDEGNSRALRIKFDAMHLQKLVTLKMLCGKLPDEKELIFIETTKSFNAFTFIVYLIKHAGRIDDLMIKTYSINARILDSLTARIHNNEVGNICLYIAESIRYRMPRVKDQIDTMTKEFENFTVEYAWTHQKVICARVGTDYYVVEGSGNFSENSAEEQYLFTKSKQLYEFRSGNN